jgi:hypothetical protein
LVTDMASHDGCEKWWDVRRQKSGGGGGGFIEDEKAGCLLSGYRGH